MDKKLHLNSKLLKFKIQRTVPEQPAGSKTTESDIHTDLNAKCVKNVGQVKVVLHTHMSELNRVMEQNRKERIKIATRNMKAEDERRMIENIFKQLHKPDPVQLKMQQFAEDLDQVIDGKKTPNEEEFEALKHVDSAM